MCKALCSDRALMELAEWVGGWVDVPMNDKARTLPQSTDYTWAAGSACKSPGENWKEGKRASIFKHRSLCSWPAETAHDGLQPQNRISMHIFSYCNPSALIRWSSLTLLHTWIWDEWSSNSAVLTNSKFHTKYIFIASHVQFLHYSSSHCTHTGLE